MLKVIQVGVGGYGASWLPTIMENEGVEHVALVDLNADHLEKARQSTGLAESVCFAQVDEAIAAVEADALMCIVPPAHHEAVICAGITAGLHVLSEKPIADTAEASRRILERVAASDRVFMISQKARFHPWVRKFREIVQHCCRRQFHAHHWYAKSAK